jgi:SEC-C motif
MQHTDLDEWDDVDDFWADPRAGELIEQAEEIQRLGGHDAALELLDRAIVIGSADAGYAMAARAMSFYQLGRPGDARAELEALRKHRPFSAIAFHLAAEAAEMNGDERLALRWFDMALSRCADQMGLGERSEAEMAGQVAMLVLGRRRVRRSLGLPPDDLDRAGTAEPKVQNPAYSGSLPPGVATSTSLVRVLFWPRDQIRPAAARWPTLVQETDIDMVTGQRELENRRIVAEDGARIVMVPLTVESLTEFATRAGGNPLSARTRSKALEERFERGDGISWPPGRNAQCWCGSAVKYKKCCGAIQSSSTSTSGLSVSTAQANDSTSPPN